MSTSNPLTPTQAQLLVAVGIDPALWNCRSAPFNSTELTQVQKQRKLDQMSTQELRILYKEIQLKKKAVQKARARLEVLALLRRWRTAAAAATTAAGWP
jgi:hypothetical protein